MERAVSWVSTTAKNSHGKPSAPAQLVVGLLAAAAVSLLAFVVIPVKAPPARKRTPPAPFAALLASLDEGSPVAVSPRSIGVVAGHLKAPVYWAGPRAGYTLRLRTNWDGNIFLRYLTAGTPLDTRDEAWLTVATYPYKSNPYGELAALATRAGYGHRRLAAGRLVVWPPNGREAYFARSGSPVLVEVYDPTRGVAVHEVLTGQVRSVS
ncbi:MAG TPA: hypothetical protein VIC05_05900 [Solirubrobacteraceae bacterium]